MAGTMLPTPVKPACARGYVHKPAAACLHRDADGAADGAGRLRQYGQVGGAAATAHGATATVEQGQGHAKLIGHLGQRLLRHAKSMQQLVGATTTAAHRQAAKQEYAACLSFKGLNEVGMDPGSKVKLWHSREASSRWERTWTS